MCTDQRASNVQPKEKLALASILAGGHVNFQVPHNRLVTKTHRRIINMQRNFLEEKAMALQANLRKGVHKRSGLSMAVCYFCAYTYVQQQQLHHTTDGEVKT